MIADGLIDPIGFVADDLASRGGLVERSGDTAMAVLPPDVARALGLAEVTALSAASGDAVGCGLGSPLLDQLVAETRATVAVASVKSPAQPPTLGFAERAAERLVVRNGVADVLSAGHASATYLAGVFTWTAEADDRYQGMAFVAAHAGSGSEPDGACTATLESLVCGDEISSGGVLDARAAIGGASAVARRAALLVGPRLDEVGAAVARRRRREQARLDEYFDSLIAEARRPRRQVARDAIAARVSALQSEHRAKIRDLTARYTLRVKLEVVALCAIAMRIAEVRIRLRRRKGERELTLQVPPGARNFDALVCAACPSTTRSPLLCDDALHVLCEDCAPGAGGRPRCPACGAGRGARTVR